MKAERENHQQYFSFDDLLNRYRLKARQTIYKWLKEGEFPKPIKIGGKPLWLAREIKDYDAAQLSRREGVSNDGI